MFASLHARDFRVFVSGQLVSYIGGWTQRIAQDWLVLSLTGSTAAVGLTTALQFLPTLLLGPWGGSLADRLPKRTILLFTQTVMGICAVLLSVLVLTGQVQAWQIYVIATLLGITTAVDNPTRQSFVNEMVGPALLRNAISLNSAAFQLGALVGPAVSGITIAVFGIGWAFALNAASFSVALYAVRRLPRRSVDRTAVEQNRHAGGITEAFHHMREHPRLWWPMVLMAGFALFTTNFPVTLTAFASGVFHSGPGGLALLTSVLAVGSVAGSLLAARQANVRLRHLIWVGAAVCLTQLLAALAPSEPIFLVLLVLLGVSSVMLGVSANSTVQLAAADNMRGRVMGIYLLAVIGAGCIGGPLVGWVDQLWGARSGLLLGAVLPGVTTLIVVYQLARTTGRSRLRRTAERVG